MEKQDMLKEAKRKLEDQYCVQISPGAFDLAFQGLRTFDSKLIFDDEKAMEILEGASKLVSQRFRDCAYERGFYQKAYQLRWALVELTELYSNDVDSDLGSWVTRLRWDRDDASIFINDYLGELGLVVESCRDKHYFLKHIKGARIDFDVVQFRCAIQDGLIFYFRHLLTVTDSDVAEMASNLSDVPATHFLPSIDYQKRMAIKLTSNRVLEQEHVISEIYETLTSSPRHMSSSSISSTRPRGSFLLFGPSGAGKTEIIKSVAEHWYCDATRLVEIDVSDYAEESVFLGHLSEIVARRPYSVIALDKIEKATPSVTRALVDVLSNKGSLVDLSNSILFMTSSVGSDQLDLSCKCHQREDDSQGHDCFGHERVLIEARKLFGGDLLDSVDKVLAVKWFYNYKSVFRLLLREVVREVTGQRLVVHVSQDALYLLFLKALADQFLEEGGKALKRTLLKHVMPGLPAEGGDLNNVVVHVDLLSETRELLFSFRRHEQSVDDWYFKLEDGIFEKWMSNLRTKVESVGRIFKLRSEYLLDSDNIGSPQPLVDYVSNEIKQWIMFRVASGPSAPSSWRDRVWSKKQLFFHLFIFALILAISHYL